MWSRALEYRNKLRPGEEVSLARIFEGFPESRIPLSHAMRLMHFGLVELSIGQLIPTSAGAHVLGLLPQPAWPAKRGARTERKVPRERSRQVPVPHGDRDALLLMQDSPRRPSRLRQFRVFLFESVMYKRILTTSVLILGLAAVGPPDA